MKRWRGQTSIATETAQDHPCRPYGLLDADKRADLLDRRQLSARELPHRPRFRLSSSQFLFETVCGE